MTTLDAYLLGLCTIPAYILFCATYTKLLIWLLRKWEQR